MKEMKKILIYTIAVLSAVGLSGCENWLDINHDPNNPTSEQMTEAIMLPAQQYAILNNMTNSTYAWTLAHYLTKSGEYSGNYTFLNGQVMPQNLNSWWQNYYYILWNLKTIQEMAVENEDPGYQAISEILQVIVFQRMVDIWGDIPYSEACNPEEIEKPKYDKADSIYTDLIARADAAAKLFESISASYSTSELSGVDIICHGDIALWTRIAYSVELRLLMRVSNVQDVSASVSAIYQKCLAIDENVDANPGYVSEDDKMNIFFQYYGWDKNLNPTVNIRQYCPTSILVDILRNNNDPRLRVYADPRRELGDDEEMGVYYSLYPELVNERYIGIPYGQANPAGIEYTSTTGTGLLAGSSDKEGGMLRATTFMTGAEVGFLLAEAALRGIIPGGDAAAKDYYERSVTSAMKRHEAAMQDASENFTNYLGDPMQGMRDPIAGTAEEAARTYLDQDNVLTNWTKMSDETQKLNAICTQKWLAFMGYNPMEAWFEHRRTDMPELPASNQGLQPRLNFSLLPYPQTERNLNMSNIPDPERNIYSALVFWDVTQPTVPATTLY